LSGLIDELGSEAYLKWGAGLKVPEMTQACAYCNGLGPLTKEHLWPAGLHRRFCAAEGAAENRFWLRRIEKEISGEPKIRDVCGQCNNGHLSTLDGYICELFDTYFVRMPERYKRVVFEFDYHRLKRWLLKTCFNSARIHDAADIFVFQALLPYINGPSDAKGRYIQLYLQLAYPVQVPAEEPVNTAQMCWPADHRVGHLWFTTPEGQKLLRAVHLRSYSFFLAFFEQGERNAAMDHFSRCFLARFPHAARLRASRPRVELTCDGYSAWESSESGRSNRLVF
jgi:hypothetical protein